MKQADSRTETRIRTISQPRSLAKKDQVEGSSM